MHQVNTFQTLNKNIDIRFLPESALRDCVNFEFTKDESYGSRIEIKGSVLAATFELTIDTNTLNILGMYEVFASVDWLNTGTFTEAVGLLVFSYENNKGSRIHFYDVLNNQTKLVWADSLAEMAGFPLKGTVDGFYYKDNCGHSFQWVDNQNSIRSIQLKFDGNALNLTLKDLEYRPLFPIDSLEYTALKTGGELLAGSYFFAYRYYNTNTQKYSTPSHFTKSIKVADTNRGGYVGEILDRKVCLSINTSIGSVGYNAIQLIIIQNVDGSREDQQTLRMTEPRQDWYTNRTNFEYTGVETLVTESVANIVIEDLPLVAGKTMIEKQNYSVIGNVQLQEFPLDLGPVGITSARTIKREILAAYSDPDEYQFVGNFRGEVEAYGIVYYDKYGNSSPVQPLDLSSFGPTAGANTLGVTFLNYLSDDDVTTFTITSGGPPAAFSGGQYVLVGGTGTYITGFSATEIGVIGDFTAFTGPLTDAAPGFQEMNQSGNWTWKFPGREMNDFTILNNAGNVEAIALEITGIRNHPNWAVGFEIVKRNPIRDIVGQTIHVPTIAVQGGALNGVKLSDRAYERSQDTFVPKVHVMGTARNIDHGVPDFSVQGRYTTQQLGDETTEVSRIIYAPLLEFLYNKSGEGINFNPTSPRMVEIIDAVSLLRTAKADDVRTKINTFAASDREQYYYNRENIRTEAGANVTKKLWELDGLANKNIPRVSPVIWSQEIISNSPAFKAITEPFDYFDIDTYGNTQAITSANIHESIPDAFYHRLGGVVKNQRGVLIGLDRKLEDFSYVFSDRYINNNDDYFSLYANKPNLKIYDDAHIEDATFFNRLWLNTPSSNTGEVACGAYILNVKKGLGSGRYGDMNAPNQDWVSTGTYVPLTENDITTNAPKDVQIWGGDCFIHKAQLKIHDTTPELFTYDPVDAGLSAGLGPIDKAAAVGTLGKNVEVIEVYLESYVPPKSSDQSLPPISEENGAYTNDWFYDYNFGYSKNISPKRFSNFSDIDQCFKYEEGFVWSERHISLATSNGFVETLGFNRYKTLNLKSLDGAYGPITKLEKLKNNVIYVLQERGVYVQPIGVDEFRVGDGTILKETGTGGVFGVEGSYMVRDNGTQHMRSVVVGNDFCYFVDVREKQVCRFGSQTGIDIISDKEMESSFNFLLEGSIEEDDLHGFYDRKKERYFFSQLSGLSPISFAYNSRLNNWEFEFKAPKKTKRAVFVDNHLYGIPEGIDEIQAHQLFENNSHQIYGDYFESSLQFAVNANANRHKIFNYVEIDSKNPVSTGQLIALDFAGSQNQTCDFTLTGINPRNRVYKQNQLFQTNGPSQLRMSGLCALITLKVSHSPTDDLRREIFRVITGFRNLHRR